MPLRHRDLFRRRVVVARDHRAIAARRGHRRRLVRRAKTRPQPFQIRHILLEPLPAHPVLADDVVRELLEVARTAAAPACGP